MISCLPRRKPFHPVWRGIHGFCPALRCRGLLFIEDAAPSFGKVLRYGIQTLTQPCQILRTGYIDNQGGESIMKL